MNLTNLNVKELLGRLGSGKVALGKNTYMPVVNPADATVTAKTSAYTVTAADLDAPTIFTNAGASANVSFTLPAAADVPGRSITVHALAAQTTRLVPQSTDAVNYCGSAVDNKYAQLAGVIGNFISATSDGTNWIVTNANGVVTKES